jgi:DNA-binding MarR family transcriptional regulator
MARRSGVGATTARSRATQRRAEAPAATPGPDLAFPASEAWDKPGFLLWHATLQWQRDVSSALKELSLTHVQFVLLAGTHWLERHGGPPSQRELADHSATDAMMTSQVVRALEQAGWLVREADPVDARVKRLRTTPAGADLARRAVELVEAVDARVFAGIGDLDRFRRALRSVARRDDSGRPIAEGPR